MPRHQNFPFRRVLVDHMVRGVTRVWWQLDRTFNEPGPYVFQLQVSQTPLSDTADWRNVGQPVTNAYYAADDAWREAGGQLLTHYRVTLTTQNNLYVSAPQPVNGLLPERDWLLAREIIRKEKLRQQYVAVEGVLLKPMRFGERCPCREELTDEPADSNCPVCSGTGFKVGFHPALPMQCWDISPQVIAEDIDNQMKGTTRENAMITARVIGFPALSKWDVWVNGTSDERWLIHQVKTIAQLRGVPLVYEVTMGLVPFSSGIYAIEVGGEPGERPGPVLPIEGCGSVTVDHDYGGEDELAYLDATDCPVVGAHVYVFKQSDFAAALPAYPERTAATAATITRANGRWTHALKLDPGNYVILYEKPGEYGPDINNLTVAAPPGLPITAPVIAPKPRLQGPKDETSFWDM